ncbi:MAG: RIP metalloprotease RseP [Phycisphaerae bacterium]
MTDSLLASVATTLLSVWSSAWPYLLMLLGFSAIVFVHELGHFAVAKWAGVKVERFAVGFGKELFGFTRGETRYSFNILPLGGYVKMLGQEDFDDKAKELKFNDDPRSFVNKPVGHRMAIVSAGVIMNLVFALVAFAIVFTVGMEVFGTHIGFVAPDSPADAAGLMAGDDIKKINGRTIEEFTDVSISVMLAPPHVPIEFLVERDDALKTILVTPIGNREEGRLQAGIGPGSTREIASIGPGIDASRPDSPHVGDILVEVDGRPVTDDNAVEVARLLAHNTGDVIVARPDPEDPDAEPRRIKVHVPPMLGLYPSNSVITRAAEDSPGDVLGLTPLVRFDSVAPGGRADLAGIEPGDTVLSFADTPYPNRQQIARAVRDHPEWDMEFTVLKSDGRGLRSFIRPKRNTKGPGTIQARCAALRNTRAQRAADGDKNDATGDADDNGDDEPPGRRPRTRFADVLPGGVADGAGIEVGDVIVFWDGKQYPSAGDVNRSIAENPRRAIPIVVRKPDGATRALRIRPRYAGTINADYRLVAEDVLRVGKPVDIINGRTSPAAQAGIPAGALIKAVDGEPVKSWSVLIDRFRRAAGASVRLLYADDQGRDHVADFPVPHCLRTVLGVGPEARILEIDGRVRVPAAGLGGRDDVAVSYHLGTRAALASLVAAGKTRAVVRYRPRPAAAVEEREIAVSADMVDPWLGRVQFMPNIDLLIAMKMLRGDNAFDAMRIGLHKTYFFILQVYQTMERMIFSRSIGAENISGPLGIVSIGGDFARAGAIRFLWFLGMISVNLAVINFLPLPIVDGGLMVFLIIEKIKGSPVSLRIQVATQMIGLFLIISAFLFVTFNDALKLFG